MNYYNRYPGDYARDTAHLTTFEHGIYTLLLDHIYSTEKPIANFEQASRISRTHTKGSRRALKMVLSEFFVEECDGYHSPRADREISLAQARISAARRNGMKGGRPTQRKPSGFFLGNPEGTQTKALHPPSTREARAGERARVHARGPTPEPNDPLFTKFCGDYPRKIRFKEARPPWNALSEAERMQAIEALTAFKACEQWQEESGKFIPSPERFLSERRWDQVPPAAGRQKGKNNARGNSFDPVALAAACGFRKPGAPD
jgi:uncharacterized protein YdaU (DUF1376 family)